MAFGLSSMRMGRNLHGLRMSVPNVSLYFSFRTRMRSVSAALMGLPNFVDGALRGIKCGVT